MSLIDKLFEKSSWERFYEYKSSLKCSKRFKKELREYIDSKSYLNMNPQDQVMRRPSLPSKSVISKMSSQKKRTVYKYPYDFNMILKLLTYLTLRKYDHIYSRDLYSFRPGICAKDAIMPICRTEDLHTSILIRSMSAITSTRYLVERICEAS